MEIGIIGLGDMGKSYTRELTKVGYRVNGCDLPQNREKLEQDLSGTGICILADAIAVVKRSDLIFHLVPVEEIERSVAEWGPSVKENAIVSSGASVMTPAIEAFERHLPKNVPIKNWHWLFGPSLPPQGQNTALVDHRGSKRSSQRMRDVAEAVGSKVIELSSYQEHDKITADTQAVTHVGFEAMGTAWKNMGSYPWENPTYVGGIDNVKALMCLRVYGGKPHVYSGLAIFNPFAGEQIHQYAKSVSELFSLMIQEDEQGFRERVIKGGTAIFNDVNSPILLDDKVMGEFSLGMSSEQRTPNSNLSLLSMVDSWDQVGINPYDNMICQTPVYRLRLGIAEYLFRHSDLLEESIETALYNKDIRRDDLEFHTAVREWATIIENRDSRAYHRHFEDTRTFFADRIPEGMKRSGELIQKLSKTA